MSTLQLPWDREADQNRRAAAYQARAKRAQTGEPEPEPYTGRGIPGQERFLYRPPGSTEELRYRAEMTSAASEQVVTEVVPTTTRHYHPDGTLSHTTESQRTRSVRRTVKEDPKPTGLYLVDMLSIKRRPFYGPNGLARKTPRAYAQRPTDLLSPGQPCKPDTQYLPGPLPEAPPIQPTADQLLELQAAYPHLDIRMVTYRVEDPRKPAHPTQPTQYVVVPTAQPNSKLGLTVFRRELQATGQSTRLRKVPDSKVYLRNGEVYVHTPRGLIRVA